MSDLREWTINILTEQKVEEMIKRAVEHAEKGEYYKENMEVMEGFSSLTVCSAVEGETFNEDDCVTTSDWIDYFESCGFMMEEDLKRMRTEGIRFSIVILKEFDGNEEVVDGFELHEKEKFKSYIKQHVETYMKEIWEASLEA